MQMVYLFMLRTDEQKAMLGWGGRGGPKQALVADFGHKRRNLFLFDDDDDDDDEWDKSELLRGVYDGGNR